MTANVRVARIKGYTASVLSTVVLTAAVSLTANATRVVIPAAAMAAPASLSVSASVTEPVGAALSAPASLSAASVVTKNAATGLSASVSLSANASDTTGVGAILSAPVGISATGTVAPNLGATLSAPLNLTSATSITIVSAANLMAPLGLNANAVRYVSVSATLTASFDLATNASSTVKPGASLTAPVTMASGLIIPIISKIRIARITGSTNGVNNSFLTAAVTLSAGASPVGTFTPIDLQAPVTLGGILSPTFIRLSAVQGWAIQKTFSWNGSAWIQDPSSFLTAPVSLSVTGLDTLNLLPSAPLTASVDLSATAVAQSKFQASAVLTAPVSLGSLSGSSQANVSATLVAPISMSPASSNVIIIAPAAASLSAPVAISASATVGVVARLSAPAALYVGLTGGTSPSAIFSAPVVFDGSVAAMNTSGQAALTASVTLSVDVNKRAAISVDLGVPYALVVNATPVLPATLVLSSPVVLQAGVAGASYPVAALRAPVALLGAITTNYGNILMSGSSTFDVVGFVPQIVPQTIVFAGGSSFAILSVNFRFMVQPWREYQAGPLIPKGVTD